MASGLENIETVESPFRRFVTTIGVFPTAFTDAVTYYECLAYLVKYMEETMIPAINENAEAVEELQGLYIQLKAFVDNYFDNLDVQQEINNKLDEMVEDGTLQDLINAYLQPNVEWTFDTVADMKASTNLVAGSYAQTLGFHTLNDGGGAIYKISDSGTANEMDVIAVGNLYANICTYSTINVKQLGAYGNNTNDDTSILNFALSKFKWKKVYIPSGTYKITATVNVTEGKELYGDGMFISILSYDGSSNAVEIINNYFGTLSIHDLSIHKNGGYTASDTTSVGINISKGTNNREVSNLYLTKVSVRYFGRNFNCSVAGALLNAHFDKCKFEGGYYNVYMVGGFNNNYDGCRFGEAVHSGFYQQSGESKFVACSFEGNKRGVNLLNSDGSYSFIDCFFENTDNTQASDIALITVTPIDLNLIQNISVINCHFYGAYTQVFLTKVKRATFINNTMLNAGNGCVNFGYTNPDIESIVFINNNFNIKPYTGSKFVSFVDEDCQDTGWIDVDTSNVTHGRFTNFKIRKIGKIVYWNGILDNITDADLYQATGITLPSGFIPDHPASIVRIASMSQGNQGDFSKSASIRIGNNYVTVAGYSATSNALNQIDLSSISYIGK